LILLKILICLILFLCAVKVFSQDGENISHKNSAAASLYISSEPDSILNNKNSEFKSNIFNYPSQLYYQASSVFSISKKDLPWIALAGGITIGLFALDGTIDGSVKNLKKDHGWIKNTSPYVSELGGNYGLILTGAFAGFSLITGNNKGIETSVLALESALSSGIFTRIGKVLSGRQRPSAVYNQAGKTTGKWSGPFTQFEKSRHKGASNYDAFPSGHTAEAFAIATVFANQYNNTPIIPIIFYSTASLVGISRMIEHTHWASDVFVGGVIGYLCGKSTIYFNNQINNKSKSEKVKVSFQPSFFNSSFGGNLNINF
jgi:membrane-associated phospholipid phosphatase